MKDELEKQARFFHLGEQYFWFSSQNELVDRALRPDFQRLREEAGHRPLRILDLGCGPGNTLSRLLPEGQVYGFDYSLDALSFARTKGIRCVFSGESTALPVASATFDCVIALDVLEHVDDDGGALAEIARVLRPGGVFCFTVPAFMALWRYHDEAYGHFRRYRKAEFVRRVRTANLEIRSCRFFSAPSSRRCSCWRRWSAWASSRAATTSSRSRPGSTGSSRLRSSGRIVPAWGACCPSVCRCSAWAGRAAA